MPRRHLVLALGAFLLLQLVLTTWVVRNSPEAPLHPDDAAVLRLAPEQARTGRPQMPLAAPTGGQPGYYVPFESGFTLSAASLEMFEPVGVYGRGIGLFYLAAGFEWIHAGAAQLVMPVMALVGTVAFFLLLRSEVSDAAALGATAAFATLAPTLLWSSVLMSNVASLSLFLVGLVLLRAGERRGFLLPLGVGVLALALAFRLEFVVGAGVATLVALARGRSLRAAGWLVGAWIGIGVLGILAWPTLTGEAFHPIATLRLFRDQATFLRGLVHAATFLRVSTYVWSYAPVLAAATVAFLPLLLTSGRRPGLSWALLAQGAFMLVGVGGVTGHYGDYVRWLDASFTRYFLAGYAALACLFAFGLDALLARAPARATWIAGALACLLVVAGTAQAFGDEHGLPWVAKTRATYAGAQAAAAQTEPSSILVGNAPSLAVTARPVLVEAGGWIGELDRVAGVGHPAYLVRAWTFHDQTNEPAAELLGTGHVLLTTSYGSGDDALLAIRSTNATLANAVIFNGTEWRVGNGTLQTLGPVSRVETLEGLAVRQALGQAGRVIVHLEYLDDAPRLYEGGFVNLPYGPSNTRHEFHWEGLGTGEWKSVEFALAPGETVNGPYWFSAHLTLRSLRIEER